MSLPTAFRGAHPFCHERLGPNLSQSCPSGHWPLLHVGMRLCVGPLGRRRSHQALLGGRYRTLRCRGGHCCAPNKEQLNLSWPYPSPPPPHICAETMRLSVPGLMTATQLKSPWPHLCLAALRVNTIFSSPPDQRRGALDRDTSWGSPALAQPFWPINPLTAAPRITDAQKQPFVPGPQMVSMKGVLFASTVMEDPAGLEPSLASRGGFSSLGIEPEWSPRDFWRQSLDWHSDLTTYSLVSDLVWELLILYSPCSVDCCCLIKAA